MMGARRAEQVKATADTVTKAVRSAGGVVIAALVIACAALAVALAALVMARPRPAAGG